MGNSDEEVFKQNSKKRITVIHPSRIDRKQIRTILREDGLSDIVEFDDFDEAWDRLKLSTTNVMVFPLSNGGDDFLLDIIESTRFNDIAIITFAPNPEQSRKHFGHEELIINFESEPMNGVAVEKALLSIFSAHTVGKSLVADENAALDHYTKGVAALNEENFEQAKDLFRQALKENPEFFEAYMSMADALIGLGDFETAKKVLARADKIRSNNSKTLKRIAELAAETQDKERVLKVMELAHERAPNDQMLLIDMGNIMLNKGWTDEAISLYEKARVLDPNLIHVYNRLGIAYSRQKNFGGANAMYEKALEIDPDDAGIYFNIGMMRHRMGENKEAIESFQKAAQLDPSMKESDEMIERLSAGS